jgi:hypothetical protein
MPIGWCKPVNAARYRAPELGRTSLFTIAVEIRDRFNPDSGPHAKICGGLRNSQTTRDMEIGKAATLVMLQPFALCERAYSVDTCTIAALDAIAAFASQTPAPPRRVSRFFRVWLPCRSPCRADHSAYFGVASFISPILSAVDVDQTKQSCGSCQCGFHGENEISVNRSVENEVPFGLLVR